MATIKFLRMGTDEKGRDTATFDVEGEEVTRVIAPNFQDFGKTIDEHLIDLATGLSLEYSQSEAAQDITPTFQEGDVIVEG